MVKLFLWLNGVQYRLDKQSEFLENEGIMSLSAGEHNFGQGIRRGQI